MISMCEVTMVYTIARISIFGKGILAADESSPTIAKRLKSVGVESTPESRHDYRQTLFSSPGIENYISGVILFDETIRTEATIKPLRDKGILLGVKVDKGAVPYDNHKRGEKLTEGMDGLDERLEEYRKLGATFTKWRGVIYPNNSVGGITANAYTLARYAKKSQLQGLIPIVEPEVIMDGGHSIEDSLEITERTLNIVFEALFYENVSLEEMILKPNMVLSGYDNVNFWNSLDRREVTADFTKRCLLRSVPAAVPMIAFLSGGQPDGEAAEHLSLINKEELHPWYVSFSFGRELQKQCLEHWSNGNKEKAQSSFIERARECSAATHGAL